MIYWFDLLGAFSFAFYGSHLAQKKGFDLFGILVTGLISSFAGGTLREILLSKIPIYLLDYSYILVALLGIGLSILLYKKFTNLQKTVLYVDAIGLVTFAFIGAEEAYQAGLGLVAVVIFATISAVGGGILRDLILGRVPEIFYQDFYATPAIILGLLYYLFVSYLPSGVLTVLLLVIIYVIRALAIYYKIQLWKPQKALL